MAADLHDEQAVQAPEGHRAVPVEEIGGEHRRCLAVQNFRQNVSVRRSGAGGIFSALRTRGMVDTPTRWPSLSSSPWIRWYPQPRFSVASRLISEAI